MDYLIMMLEKYLFKKEKEKRKTFDIDNFSHPVEVTGWNYIWNCVFLKDMYKNLKEIGKIQAISKLKTS